MGTTIHDTTKIMEFFQSNIDSVSKRLSGLEESAVSPQMLSRKSSGVTISGTLSESTLFSEQIPGNSLRTNNFIEMWALGLVANQSGGAVNFTWRLKYGTASLVLGPFSVTSLASAVGRIVQIYGLLKANGSENSQQFLAECTIGSGINTFTTNGLLKGYTISDITVDSSLDQTAELTIQHGSVDASVHTDLLLFKLGAPQVAS